MKLFSIAFAILVITNIFVFIGIDFNRSAKPTSSITLTERELQLPYSSNNENSGISLHVRYRIFSESSKNQLPYHTHPNWLNYESLKELGFDVDEHLNAKYKKSTLAKEVFAVLEYDGQTYQKSLAYKTEELTKAEVLYDENKDDKRLKDRYEGAKEELKREKLYNSRLFAIDTSLDYDELRKKYDDFDKYIIVKALVTMVDRDYYGDKTKIKGYLKGLSITQVHISLPYKKELETLKSEWNIEPRYSVKLNYGQRFEPWVVEVNKF